MASEVDVSAYITIGAAAGTPRRFCFHGCQRIPYNDGKGGPMAKKKEARQPPVRIPLSFERAVEGLLAVDPKGPVKKPGKK